MAATIPIAFSHKEIVECLLKKSGIHEGLWAIHVKFGLKAINIGKTDADLNPAAILGLLEIGIQPAEKETNISVDAAKVNPLPKKSKTAK